MSQDELVRKGKTLIAELADICRKVSDTDLYAMFSDGAMDQLLNGILDPSTVTKYANIGEFFLANKHRATLLAAVRLAITQHYAIKSKPKDGIVGFASPAHFQWFDDGVMVFEGREPFDGLITLYRDGRPSYAITARYIAEGEQVGPEDLHFIDIDEAKQQLEVLKSPDSDKLAAPANELRALLATCDSNESKYQKLLTRYPWALGLEYERVESHEHLDDENVPDFTAVRVTDKYCDVFEIKPPSMQVFRKDGEFSSDFNSAWNQAERYLDFARNEKDYLRRKGLNFDNPQCILICGYRLPPELMEKIRLKQRMNPSIQLLTFDDLLAFIESTIGFIRRFDRSGK